uniref:CARD domain-containing protein n=1 Tax=Stegastes partitus TaxID=144197 RepID=A0A3B5A371_9TELE
MKMITEHKVELIDSLRADLFILQHVHAKRIITDRQYQKLKHISQPEETVTNLIDVVIGKDEETCDQFLQVLKDPEVLRTYPGLKEILNIESYMTQTVTEITNHQTCTPKRRR